MYYVYISYICIMYIYYVYTCKYMIYIYVYVVKRQTMCPPGYYQSSPPMAPCKPYIICMSLHEVIYIQIHIYISR